MPRKDPQARREYMRAYQRKWQKKNNPRLREYGRRRRAKPNWPIFQRKYSLRRYGLTLEQFEAMKKEQKGLCALCGNPPKNKRGLVPDHNHRTGKVRALLCDGCNWVVGVYETKGVIPIWAYLSKYDD